MAEILRVTEHDVSDFRSTLLAYLPRYYDDVDDTLVDYYVNASLGQVLPNPTTSSVEIWKAILRERVAGYLVLVWKRWRTLKAAQLLVKEEHRRLGIGRELQTFLFQRAEETGVRKVFHTLPASEQSHTSLALSAGLQIEATLARHYSVREDELVVARAVAPHSSTATDTTFRATVAAVYALDAGPGTWTTALTASTLNGSDATELSEAALFLHAHMPHFFDPIDEGFLSRLLKRPTLRNRSDYNLHAVLLVVVQDNEQRIIIVHVVQAKRGGVLKSTVIPATTDARAHNQAARVVEEEARSLGMRKIIYEVPSMAVGCVQCLWKRGGRIEGVLRNPYKEGVDMVLVSAFPRKSGGEAGSSSSA